MPLGYYVEHNLDIDDTTILVNIDVIINCLHYAKIHNIYSINDYGNNQKYMGLLDKVIDKLLLELGYKIVEDDKTYRLMIVSNDIPINIDEIPTENIAEDVLNFYDYKNALNVVGKRKILTNLIIQLEPMRDKIEDVFGSGMEKALFTYGNSFYLRHCNVDKINNKRYFKPTIAKLTDDEFIEWYDFIYPIALMVYSKIDKLKEVNIKNDFKE